jgi:hypothetical protein
MRIDPAIRRDPIESTDAAISGTSMLRMPTGSPAIAQPQPSTDQQESQQHRPAQLSVLVGSLLGIVLLLMAHELQPRGGSPFAVPQGFAAWLGVTCGVAGVWLVPGLWLSAVMRTEAGPVAWVMTRVGVTLAWYALLGVMVYAAAGLTHPWEGAVHPTAGVILGVTITTTAMVCLGMALSALRLPIGRRTRMLVAAGTGGACAQLAAWVAAWLATTGDVTAELRRLDGWIVVTCALLAVAGQTSLARLPVRDVASSTRKGTAIPAASFIRARGKPAAGLTVDAARGRKVAVALVVLATTMVTVVAANRWPTLQRWPSGLTAEQIPAPTGADLALEVVGIGPQGSEVLRQAAFAAYDDAGRAVRIRFRLSKADRTARRATLLMVLDPHSRPRLCGSVLVSKEIAPVKLTVRDKASGLLVQAAIPTGWCAE